MKRAIVESPFKGTSKEDRMQNIAYARACCKHAVDLGYVPFASHLFFPQFLNEDVPEDRKTGIEMGYDFWDKADVILFFMDRGVSTGMEQALVRAFKENKPFEKVFLPGFRGAPVDLDRLQQEITGAPPAPEQGQPQLAPPPPAFLRSGR